MPGEGPLRLGPVVLPPGRLITGYDQKSLVAWVTADVVPDAGQAWASLSGMHSRTGLVPILVPDLPDDPVGSARDPLSLVEAENPGGADVLDVAGMLENLWRGAVFADVDDPEAMEQWAPFTLDWPGLAAQGVRACQRGRAAPGLGRCAAAGQA